MNTTTDYASWDYPEYETIRVREYQDGGGLKTRKDLEIDTPEDAHGLPPGRYRIELLKSGKPVRGGGKNLTIGTQVKGELANIERVFRTAGETAMAQQATTLKFAADIVKAYPKSLEAMAQGMGYAFDEVQNARIEAKEARHELRKYRAEVEEQVLSERNTARSMDMVEKFLDAVTTGGVTPEKVAEVMGKIPAENRKDMVIKLYSTMDTELRVQVTLLFLRLAVEHDTERVSAILANNPGLIDIFVERLGLN